MAVFCNFKEMCTKTISDLPHGIERDIEAHEIHKKRYLEKRSKDSKG